MTSNNYGEIRPCSLKTGMNAFLIAITLLWMRFGLDSAHYSVDGDGTAGKILVKAEKLGAVGSAQRTALKNAVSNLQALVNTPTAHAYAEAAAYLMGTSTLNSVQVNDADIYFLFFWWEKKMV